MCQTKYGFSVSAEAVSADINRLTNQLWKLIPMREHNEDWSSHLKKVILELTGLSEIFNAQKQFIVLLSKLEGLMSQKTEFSLYRTTVFECISLLREMRL